MPPQYFLLGSCPRCHFWFLATRPPLEEIGDHYPSDYYTEALIPHLLPSGHTSFIERARRRRMLNEKVSRATKLVLPGGSILDVGAGSGDFLAAMSSRGYRVAGCEFSSEMREFARRTFNIRLSSGDLLEWDGPEGSFDLVTFWESLEHLHRAKANLLRAHQLLKPRGRLIISVPNGGSLADRVSHVLKVSAQDFPRHLWIFDVQSLKTLLDQCGFSPTGVSYWTSLNGPRWSFVTDIPAKKASTTENASCLWMAVARALRGASYLLDAALSPVGLSAGMVVSAQRL